MGRSVLHAEIYELVRRVVGWSRSMKVPTGLFLPEGKTMKDILEMHAELFALEGLDPPWLVSDNSEQSTQDEQDSR